jgi:hypothetical protein
MQALSVLLFSIVSPSRWLLLLSGWWIYLTCVFSLLIIFWLVQIKIRISQSKCYGKSKVSTRYKSLQSQLAIVQAAWAWVLMIVISRLYAISQISETGTAILLSDISLLFWAAVMYRIGWDCFLRYYLVPWVVRLSHITATAFWSPSRDRYLIIGMLWFNNLKPGEEFNVLGQGRHVHVSPPLRPYNSTL